MSVREPSSRNTTPVPPGAGSPSKYDLVLAAVPALLFAGAVGGTRLSLPTPTAAGVGSALAALVVAYGLFVSPPGGSRRAR
ncbi:MULTISPECIES: hypothetical protein [Halobaculum]|uniref:Uncharacterized protein n=2 Tax=Halobaculum TaxID=43927 RepID=A0ABD5W8B0_9EURY|nr:MULTISPECIES: hypothetical protein [unclassified Halobaculum]